MNGCQAIVKALQGTQFVLEMYLSDLADADLLARPTGSANHIAWQLGHTIYAEQMLVGAEVPDVAWPALPADFAEKHSKEASGAATGFLTKDQYLDLFRKTRAATIAAVGKLADSDLDRATKGKLAQFAPTVGELLLLTSNHTLMHAGQFSVVRRHLGKPVLF